MPLRRNCEENSVKKACCVPGDL